MKHATRSNRALLVLALLSFAAWPGAPAGAQLILELLDSSSAAISADGSTVVGMSFTLGTFQASRWTRARGTEGLGDLPGGESSSFATAVSASGGFVVGLSSSANGTEAFRWTPAGGMEGLGDIEGGGFHSEAYGVSGDGSVVAGYASYGSGFHAFRWKGGTMEDLDDLDPKYNHQSYAFAVSADGSVIAGSSDTAYPLLEHEACLWKEGEDGPKGLGQLPGSPTMFSRALALSADGSVVAGWGTSGSSGAAGHEAFIWSEGKMEGLGDLPGGRFYSEAYAVSRDGSMVLGMSETGRGQEAFV
ncbi:MAG: PEP-CTERM sorting domain-containing protein [Planctomycetes bacterium]|nr:PEP-CTERM sorting domain-containing protein [Planctomycetota bacterium]